MPNQTDSILTNAVALSVNISKIGTRKKVDSKKMKLREEEGNQPDQSSIAVNKELISTPSFDAIIKLDNTFRSELYKLTLPNPLFRSGTYLIPVDLIEKIDNLIETYKEKRNEKISKFINDYDNAVYAACERLGGLFNINDYPDPDTVKRSFQVSSQYIEIGLPTKLDAFSPEIFKREKERFNDKLVSASEEITAAMRESFKQLIDHMVERLKPGDNGKPKIFRDSLVTNLREFMENFNARNITNDEELEKLVTKAKNILGTKSANDVRCYDNIKNEVVSKMTEIKDTLSGMVMDAPKRKFKFDD